MTHFKRKRGLFFKDENGVVNPSAFAHMYVPPLKKMEQKVICPCHQREMIIKVADGQAINLRKECKRQTGKSFWEK